MKFDSDCQVLWQDRKRYLGMPISFYRYYIVKKGEEWVKFFRHKGLIHSVVDEINVYRCTDVRLKISFWDRIFRTGTIEIASNDDHVPVFHLRRIKNPLKVRDMISDIIEIERRKKQVTLREFMG